MTNSTDPDQMASSEAKLFRSALFAKTGHVVFSKRRVNRCANILGKYGIQSLSSKTSHENEILVRMV